MTTSGNPPFTPESDSSTTSPKVDPKVDEKLKTRFSLPDPKPFIAVETPVPSRRDARRKSQLHLPLDDLQRQLGLEDAAPTASPRKYTPGISSLQIAGRAMKIKSIGTQNPNPSLPLQSRTWDKTKRATLEPDIRNIFQEKATRYVLPKNNKLQIRVSDANDELKHVYSLRAQLTSLRDHLYQMDIDDVFTIVCPVDVKTTNALHPEHYDLFRDYLKLKPIEVAASSKYYATWVDEPYLIENMAISLAFLKANTEETLWQRCSDDSLEFPPETRGGPLMFSLIMQRIQDSSELAMSNLLTQLRTLKISDISGENVAEAVDMIRATYTLLVDSSTPERNYIPEDFEKTLLRIFQTTSVKPFNDMFLQEETEALRVAYKTNSPAKYPDAESTLQLASGLYSGMRSTWNGATSGASFNYKNTLTCWNCGKTGHGTRSCPSPKDDARITANRTKWEQANPEKAKQRSQRKGNRPKRKTGTDGKPLILNCKGVYVLDQAKHRLAQKEKEKAAEKASDASATQDTPTEGSVASPTSVADSFYAGIQAGGTIVRGLVSQNQTSLSADDASAAPTLSTLGTHADPDAIAAAVARALR